MKTGMWRGLVLLVAVVALETAFDCATGASAQPYCRHTDGAVRCDYSSLHQCQATASGGLGFCEKNHFHANNARAELRDRRWRSKK
jgi:hypothetical protein